MRSLTRSRVVGSAALIAVTCMLAAACGSSKSSSSSSSGSSSAPTPGVTATSITVGSHQPLTGPVAPGYSEIAPATKALFAYVNAKGGVDGRTINYVYQDDAYNPSQTATVVRQLVLQNNVFAILNGLGTPTHEQVQAFLNTSKVPDLFVASGCVCWNNTSQYPWTSGYQTNYAIEGRILGKYIHDNFAGQKIGYLLQNDDVGQGGQSGLDKEIPASDVASKQNYDVSALASGLGTQMAALQAAHVQVVAGFSVPAATALAILAATQIGYHPTWVLSSINADYGTLAGLLQSFSKGKAGGSLIEGIITAGYLPSANDMTNPWVQLFKKIHDQYDASNPFDQNAVYGMSVGYNFVQLLQKVGKNLTRQALLDALNSANLTGPGLIPLTFSSSDHRGYEGERMAKFQGGATVAFGPVYKATETGAISSSTVSQEAPPANF
jgi:branched-chain amino acid transport system substrate-binding protein